MSDKKLIFLFVLLFILVCVGFYFLSGFLVSKPQEPAGVEGPGSDDPYYQTDYKPILYFYPAEETAVSVSFDKPDLLAVSYPEYSEGWSFIAYPDGRLDYSGLDLYSLYYESFDYPVEVTDVGFCLSKDMVASFLEEKLDVLGLNYKEKEEMIIYWLPKLMSKDYVYIRFESFETIDSHMHLDIEPQPDTLIRILMVMKPLDEPIEVKEQELFPVSREGFTVVEWGGTILE